MFSINSQGVCLAVHLQQAKVGDYLVELLHRHLPDLALAIQDLEQLLRR